LRERNETLQAEVSDLKQGREAIEERARSELGMIAPDETFIRVLANPIMGNNMANPAESSAGGSDSKKILTPITGKKP